MSYQFSRTVRAQSRDELLARLDQAEVTNDVLAEEQTVEAIILRLRAASTAKHDYLTSRLHEKMTWEEFEALCDDPAYCAICAEYDNAYAAVRELHRRREAGY